MIGFASTKQLRVGLKTGATFFSIGSLSNCDSLARVLPPFALATCKLLRVLIGSLYQGGSRIFLRRGWTSKEWRHWPVRYTNFISEYEEERFISGRGGPRTPYTLPLDPPLCIVCVIGDWVEWSLWIWFYDTQLKNTVSYVNIILDIVEYSVTKKDVRDNSWEVTSLFSSCQERMKVAFATFDLYPIGL